MFTITCCTKLLRVIFIKIYFLYKLYISPICVMYIFLLSGLADDLSNQGYHKNNYYNNDQADTYYDCGKFIRFFHQIKYIFAVIHNLTIMGCRIVFRYICNAISICITKDCIYLAIASQAFSSLSPSMTA